MEGPTLQWSVVLASRLRGRAARVMAWAPPLLLGLRGPQEKLPDVLPSEQEEPAQCTPSAPAAAPLLRRGPRATWPQESAVSLQDGRPGLRGTGLTLPHHILCSGPCAGYSVSHQYLICQSPGTNHLASPHFTEEETEAHRGEAEGPSTL